VTEEKATMHKNVVKFVLTGSTIVGHSTSFFLASAEFRCHGRSISHRRPGRNTRSWRFMSGRPRSQCSI